MFSWKILNKGIKSSHVQEAGYSTHLIGKAGLNKKNPPKENIKNKKIEENYFYTVTFR